jgi:hypothetical protein
MNSHMQKPTSYSPLRRILFPYSGEDALSLKQSLRVLLAWMLFFSLPMTLLPLLLPVLNSYSWQRMTWLFLFAFLSGVFIFGSLGLLVVVINNKSAHIRQAKKYTGVSTSKASNVSGDKYGS